MTLPSEQSPQSPGHAEDRIDVGLVAFFFFFFNNNLPLLSTYSVSGTLLCILHVLTHLFLTGIKGGYIIAL